MTGEGTGTAGGLRARVMGVGLWTPGYKDSEAWRAQAVDPEVKQAKAKVLDRQCSRRASPFGKAMALAFQEAVGQADVDVTEIATVFGSSLGETHVMLKLLDQMGSGSDDFSPMLFAISVHNAASGLVSISTKNRAFTTSVAADYDTPAMGLMEAIGASLDLGVPAVLVCGDDIALQGIVPEIKFYQAFAGAIVVDASPAGADRPGLADLTGLSLHGDGGMGNLPEVLENNPQAGLLDLIDAILHRRFGRVRLDRGDGAGWAVEVAEAK